MTVLDNSVLFDVNSLPSPCFIVDKQGLERNLSILSQVQEKTGAKILLALKGFAMFHTFPLLRKVLAGACASSPDEARLAKEEFGGEVHSFSVAYSQEALTRILATSDHVVFNSLGQWRRFKGLCQQQGKKIKFGLRINPEHSETKTAMYDPCRPDSRLGIRRQELADANLEGISGLHFHTLCEHDSHALERTLQAVEKKFAHFLSELEWINFGGGHHITSPDYNAEHLCRLITSFKHKFNVDVYLEPGEAVALHAGYFVTTVLDIVRQGVDIAILDCSVATHLPDVVEMPYRPEIIGADAPWIKPYTYRLGGISCLAGDIIGDYSFAEPLAVGDKLIFTDMAHYTMVKTTTFNGIRLPSIALSDKGNVQIIRKFGYEDFKNRLS